MIKKHKIKNQMLRRALFYRKREISVIPVGKNKKPLFSWKEYTNRLPTRSEIKVWWKENPKANVAIITGEISGLTVIDIEKGGKHKYLPETLISRTGGGGYHYYYRYSSRFKNGVRIKPLTDLRNNSGYVVAPPSMHSSGKRYKWLNKEDLAPFPVTLFHAEAVEEAQKGQWDEILEGVAGGSRNDSATKVCGLFLTKTPYKLWEQLAWPAIKEWNQKNVPPLSEKELRGVFDSISGRITYHKEDYEQEVFSMKDVTIKHKKVMEQRKTGKLEGVPSGIKALDNKLNGGFKQGDLILIGARPSIGKTSLALSIAYNASRKRKNVLFFSIEMSSIDIYDRLLSYITNKRCNDIIQGTVSTKVLKKAYVKAKKLNLSIVELAKATSEEVIEVVKSKLIEEKIDLIVVDYLQYLRDSEGKNGNSASRIGKISKNLKMLARMTNIPVISPVQLNRKSEGRTNKKPELFDLRDSGDLEADADVVMLLSRSLTEEYRERADLEIAKNRKGETGLLKLKFNSKTTRFSSEKFN